uniref:Uncharacterized protein n=1 Tax=Curvibacter symbiont subsp. Hydra magnipapillata TaxID=667019 RepID=C9Y8W8_CURXX|nr:hypothetical protein Csp_A05690 [Curvibacter putative symbiont of Hydra magnipapillata]
MDIANATNSSYTLTQNEVGKTITVVVSSATDATQKFTSLATGTVAFVNTPAQVSISGTPDIGQVLNAQVSDDDGVPGSITYQWLANGSVISGQTGATLTVTSALADKAIAVNVSYTDVKGGVENRTSATRGPVPLELSNSTNDVVEVSTANTTHTVRNFVAWNGTSGDKLNLTSLLTNYNSANPITDWVTSMQKVGADTVITIDPDSTAGSAPVQTLTFTNVDLTGQTIQQLKDNGVFVASRAATGAVSVSGTPAQGATLTAVTSAVTDPDNDTLSFAYQWQVSNTYNGLYTNVATNGTSSTYTLAADQSQLGQFFRVVVTATGDGTVNGTSFTSAVPAVLNTPLVLAATGATDTATDNVLSDGGLGSLVQLSQLGLSPSQLGALQSIKFTSLTNLQLFSLATAGDPTGLATNVTSSLATTILSLADLISGKYLIKYSQSDEATAGRLAAGAFTVTPTSGSTYDAALDIVISTATGVAAWGDESGYGGRANLSTTVGAGAGGIDTLLGTTQADILFGDGSGGGAGGAVLSGSLSGGGAGSGFDNLFAGAGDDILFGDGFAGNSVTGGSTSGANGGYGGGGGGSASLYAAAAGVGGTGGVGAGAGGSTTANTPPSQSGGSSTLGYLATGTAPSGTSKANNPSGGQGAGVSADSDATASINYVAELDSGADSTAGQFNNAGGTVSGAVINARAAFLDGPGGTNLEDRLFTQTMGTGNDILYGGSGNDYIMGGNGDDVITGGQGNDIMYGRGGGALSGTDNDTFVWQRGDAGPTNTSTALDIVRDFTAWNGSVGDKLNLTQLLEGYTSGGSTLTDWVKSISTGVAGSSLTSQGVVAGSWDASQTGTLITIDVDGIGAGSATQYIFLAGTTLSTTDVNALKTSGVIIA